MPGDFLPVQGESDCEIFRGELAATCIGQVQGVGVDVYSAEFVASGAELWYWEVAVQKD